jgi:hypothetical protein
LDFQAVKSEFRAASDGRLTRDLCRFSAIADARRGGSERPQYCGLPTAAAPQRHGHVQDPRAYTFDPKATFTNFLRT